MAGPTDQLLERIDTLIRIQALQAVAHLGTKTEKIMFLNEAGLQPKEIASIVGLIKLGLTQDELGAALGMHRTTIARMFPTGFLKDVSKKG